ncbi:hypothetical protein SAMN04488498_101411 [Mesorhizobium albiziae]|uniref:Helix-turn-helix domain-containing protein n=1 Tax=Neomesorhizobium albiziae TaxID=335020 RepID=A0A1I3VFE4_9HYPH|nr:hypothetical protein GCM10007937_05770 [Mesorhizobium albiziae]SFJ93870.1 hypothetical protein SAMN04488498_101411 [Mesorhizobium albiziae]
MTPRYLCTKAAARYLGLSYQWLEIARHRGGGPLFVKLGRAVRYDTQDLDSFMQAQKRQHTAQAIPARPPDNMRTSKTTPAKSGGVRNG